MILDNYRTKEFKQRDKEGLLLVEARVVHPEHYTIHLWEKSFYENARNLQQERGVPSLDGIVWAGEPALFTHKGRVVVRLPGLYLALTDGLEEGLLKSATREFRYEEVKSYRLEYLQQHSLFLPAAADENKELFKSVRKALRKGWKRLLPPAQPSVLDAEPQGQAPVKRGQAYVN